MWNVTVIKGGERLPSNQQISTHRVLLTLNCAIDNPRDYLIAWDGECLIVEKLSGEPNAPYATEYRRVGDDADQCITRTVYKYSPESGIVPYDPITESDEFIIPYVVHLMRINQLGIAIERLGASWNTQTFKISYTTINPASLLWDVEVEEIYTIAD